jgi:hypothetical protein
MDECSDGGGGGGDDGGGDVGGDGNVNRVGAGSVGDGKGRLLPP